MRQEPWIHALWQISAVAKTIVQIKSLGFTDDEILRTQRWHQAKAFVDSWMH